MKTISHMQHHLLFSFSNQTASEKQSKNVPLWENLNLLQGDFLFSDLKVRIISSSNTAYLTNDDIVASL